MSDTYTEEDLKGMSRVELRRAAIAVLGIDNKECSNTKSGELIDRIIGEQDGGGGGKGKGRSRSKASSTKKASTSKGSSNGRGRGRSRAASKPAEEEAPEASGDMAAVIERLDALGAELDKTQLENKEALEVIADQQSEIQRQQFIIFGLSTDVYKFVGEPDELEERLNDLDAEWEAQGNEEGGD